MSELRQNLATREWVVIAPERGLKPKNLAEKDTTPSIGKLEYSSNCPFCPGNEGKFPVIETLKINHENSDNWVVRTIENEYKILGSYPYCPVQPERFKSEGIYMKTQGCGFHDLVIESPFHNKTIATMSSEEVEYIIDAYLDRYYIFGKNTNNLITVIFKNHGVKAGASQHHAHSQVVGSRVVPIYTRFLLQEAQRYWHC